MFIDSRWNVLYKKFGLNDEEVWCKESEDLKIEDPEDILKKYFQRVQNRNMVIIDKRKKFKMVHEIIAKELSQSSCVAT